MSLKSSLVGLLSCHPQSLSEHCSTILERRCTSRGSQAQGFSSAPATNAILIAFTQKSCGPFQVKDCSIQGNGTRLQCFNGAGEASNGGSDVHRFTINRILSQVKAERMRSGSALSASVPLVFFH